MRETLLNWFANVPDRLSVILLSALPITELRVSLPLALFYYDFSPWQAVILSAIGNTIPIPIIFFLIPPFLAWAESNSPTLHQFFQNYLRRLEQKYAERYHRYGAFFLFIFVAVPLPGSGVWTGSLLAVIFGMKPKYSVPAVFFGMLTSAAIVLGLSLYANSV
jgi:uncharacterized membrane protein